MYCNAFSINCPTNEHFLKCFRGNLEYNLQVSQDNFALVPADDRTARPVRDVGGVRGARLPRPDALGGPGPAAPPHALNQPGRAAHLHLSGSMIRLNRDFGS